MIPANQDYVSLDLELLRASSSSHKSPFRHQLEAFGKLTETFIKPKSQPGSGLLVLPTGAGKTFTAVRWLCEHILPRNIKVVWMAPSFHLLNQAMATFKSEAAQIAPPKQTLNIRCVSSNPAHAHAAKIQTTDDVLIVTISTAISNLHPEAYDATGRPLKTAFNRFIECYRDEELFVVVDEAHHTPAYGCRNLLVREDPKEKQGLRYFVPKMRLLGLTATPTYTDQRRRGWLGEIFYDGVVYEAEKEKLIAEKILSRPNYISVDTGTEMEVDDRLYNRLKNEHKDLPEDIIDKLARNQSRNDFIVNYYVNNKDKFGKTIIFADRWFQCIYLKDKLLKKGIKADAIYSHIDADPGSVEARNTRNQSENGAIIQQFKTDYNSQGQYDSIDVLINVRMLTEGADVPSVRTVFITRQTTSSILLTQMMGRALRGSKAGGADEANIALFFDNWKGINGVWPLFGSGDKGDSPPQPSGLTPPQLISIHLVEELVRAMEATDPFIPDFDAIMPMGWYTTEIVYADGDSLEVRQEYVLVYKPLQEKTIELISEMLDCGLEEEWAREDLDQNWIDENLPEVLDIWFDLDSDPIGGNWHNDMAKLVRHVAQTKTQPQYFSFDQRDDYDIAKIVEPCRNLRPEEINQQLRRIYSDPNLLWTIFYKTFTRFQQAALVSIYADPSELGNGQAAKNTPQSKNRSDELSEELREQVFRRANYTCLCCGAQRSRGVRLQVDHIMPVKFGGSNNLSNLQTLCGRCNRLKGINAMDFSRHVTQMKKPREVLKFESRLSEREALELIITRAVNCFYHCKAVCEVRYHTRRNGKYYFNWEIQLYAGNPPQWLQENSGNLLEFIHTSLGYEHVESVRVIAPI